MTSMIVKIVFLALLAVSAFLSPALSLLTGVVMELVLGNPFPVFSKKASKKALQGSVVGLGIGMNLFESLAAGKQGMLFTIVSVVGVMCIGVLIGKWMKVNQKSAYLIATGTAICGGSAIAAVGPVIDADDDQMSMSLATIFILNTIALFVFPPIGRWIGLSQEQFGLWAAIAIHDTSSVVGAGAAYGQDALQIATTVKLTRALWIIPLALVSSLIFRAKGKKVSIPWFILLFVLAMVLNTFLPIPSAATGLIVMLSRKLLCMTLFLIGCGLSLSSIKKVGARPLALGVLLWIVISISTLAVACLLS
ncbi:MAG: putative sulfate exporter family transporter [Bacteroidales bacterium]|nr:putative sulfate exporter family transporter [Bacteroidales bacterium]